MAVAFVVRFRRSLLPPASATRRPAPLTLAMAPPFRRHSLCSQAASQADVELRWLAKVLDPDLDIEMKLKHQLRADASADAGCARFSPTGARVQPAAGRMPGHDTAGARLQDELDELRPGCKPAAGAKQASAATPSAEMAASTSRGGGGGGGGGGEAAVGINGGERRVMLLNLLNRKKERIRYLPRAADGTQRAGRRLRWAGIREVAPYPATAMMNGAPRTEPRSASCARTSTGGAVASATSAALGESEHAKKAKKRKRKTDPTGSLIGIERCCFQAACPLRLRGNNRDPMGVAEP